MLIILKSSLKSSKWASLRKVITLSVNKSCLFEVSSSELFETGLNLKTNHIRKCELEFFLFLFLDLEEKQKYKQIISKNYPLSL